MNYPASPQGYGQPVPPAPAAQYPPQQQFAPQYPQAPAQLPPQQQGYPVAPPAPQYPGYPAAPAQGYAQPYGQPAPQPVANATIADFYNQPSSGGGPGLSWTNKAGAERPIGSWFAGYISRDVNNGDVAQQTNPQGAPQFFRDGRPKLQMKVALKGLQTSDGGVDHPEGEGTWYVRGQARDELTRAMAEAGVDGVPAGGAYVIVTLVQRRPNPGFRPSNIVQVSYTPAAGTAPAAPATPAPVAEQPVQQAAPIQAPVPPAAPVAPPAVPIAAQVPAPVAAPVQPAPVPVAPVAPVQVQAPVAPPQAPVPPAGLDPNAAQILAGLTAQAPAQVPAQA